VHAAAGPDGRLTRVFQFRHLQFTYLATTGRFELDRPLHPLRDLRERLKIPLTTGISPEEHAKRLVWHGRNTLDVQMPSWRKMLAGEEVVSPLMWCVSSRAPLFDLVGCASHRASQLEILRFL
jgi:hypothetical protein